VIRHLSEKKEKVTLTSDIINQVVESVRVPSNPFDQIDLILEYIYSKTMRIGRDYAFKNEDFPIAFCENRDEFWYLISSCEELKYLEKVGGPVKKHRLTLEGWKKVIEQNSIEKGSKAFVAMWFDKELNSIWHDGIKQALEATGYDPIRIDNVEHNEKICDRIIAEINKAKLVIADFTGHRGGVYFEAGYALGRNIPVIWTCREDDIKNAHFDTRQYNHITWNNAGELRDKLISRVSALNLQPKYRKLRK
jgi:nucleoside 2-deoxyribosyltransferase